eukprot:7383334-Heterocapsa_arctica.AAC.1
MDDDRRRHRPGGHGGGAGADGRQGTGALGRGAATAGSASDPSRSPSSQGARRGWRRDRLGGGPGAGGHQRRHGRDRVHHLGRRRPAVAA